MDFFSNLFKNEAMANTFLVLEAIFKAVVDYLPDHKLEQDSQDELIHRAYGFLPAVVKERASESELKEAIAYLLAGYAKLQPLFAK